MALVGAGIFGNRWALEVARVSCDATWQQRPKPGGAAFVLCSQVVVLIVLIQTSS